MSKLACHGISIVLSIILALLNSSCATLSRYHEPVRVPVVYQPIFLRCWPMDRNAIITVKRAGTRVFSSEMVWSIPDAQSSDIQFNSLLGDTVFQVSRRLPKWQLTGPQNLEISENIRGVLTVNGFEIPVLAEEVGCILAGTWPAEWLRQADIQDSVGGMVSIKGADQLRDFDITMRMADQPQSNRSDDIQSCAVLRWGGFLGLMRRQVTFCREQTAEGLQVSLTGVNDYVIDWVIHNES